MVQMYHPSFQMYHHTCQMYHLPIPNVFLCIANVFLDIPNVSPFTSQGTNFYMSVTSSTRGIEDRHLPTSTSLSANVDDLEQAQSDTLHVDLAFQGHDDVRDM